MSRERFQPHQPPQGGFCSSGSSPCASLALGSWELLLGTGRDWLQQQLLRISQLFVSLCSSAMGIMCHGRMLFFQPALFTPVQPGLEFCRNSAGIAAVVGRGCSLGEVQLFPLPWK